MPKNSTIAKTMDISCQNCRIIMWIFIQRGTSAPRCNQPLPLQYKYIIHHHKFISTNTMLFALSCLCEVWLELSSLLYLLRSLAGLNLVFFFVSCGCVNLMALICTLTISCVPSSDGRGFNFVPLLKKKVLTQCCFVVLLFCTED